MSSSSSSAACKRKTSNPPAKNPGLTSSSAPWAPGSNPFTSSSSKLSSASKNYRRSSPFTDFGCYMTEKNRKLREQFDASAQSSSWADEKNSSSIGGIFHGVSIFVDGFTVPSAQELRAYMLRQGGRVENYFSRHRVTHIICNNLPDSKLRNLRSFCRGIPVVKPAWIVDSLEANKLLSWSPYQFNELLNESCKQQKLSSYFDLKGNSSLKSAECTDESCENFEAGVVLPKNREGARGEADPEFSKFKTQESEEDFNAREENSSEIRQDELYTDEDKCSTMHGCNSSLRHRQHSTAGDPNFVENYFKVPRCGICLS